MPTHGSWHSDNLYLDLERERGRGSERKGRWHIIILMTHSDHQMHGHDMSGTCGFTYPITIYHTKTHLPPVHTHTLLWLDKRWVPDFLIQILWFCYSLGSSNSIVSLASHLEVCILDTGWTAAGSVRHCRLALPKLLAEEHEHGNSSCLWSILVVEERQREPWSWAYALRQRLSNTRVAMINLCFDYEASRNRSNLLSEGTFVLHYATAAIDDVDVARLTGLTTRGNPRGQRSRISRQNPAQYARARARP